MNQYHAIPIASTFGHVETTPSGEVLLTPGNFRDLRLYLSPDKARDLARILNEATDHIENHQDTRSS